MATKPHMPDRRLADDVIPGQLIIPAHFWDRFCNDCNEVLSDQEHISDWCTTCAERRGVQ